MSTPTAMRCECAWCGARLPDVPCEPELAELVSHGMCADCQQRAMAELDRVAPAPLPTAEQCPPSLCFQEVVVHPQGGWTHAMPIDATRSTIRLFRGWWPTAAAAQAALDGQFAAHA